MSHPDPAEERRPRGARLLGRLPAPVVSRIGRALRHRRAGGTASLLRSPELAAPAAFELGSPRFADGGPIPLRHAGRGRGDDVSPALAWSGLPTGTRQLLLVMEDRDVPLPRPILHALALLEPGEGGAGEVPDGALDPHSPAPGVRLLPGSAGRIGYHGPRPLPGHGVHHYGFHLFALARRVPDEASPGGLADLLPLVAGHVLAAGLLTGTQEQA